MHVPSVKSIEPLPLSTANIGWQNAEYGELFYMLGMVERHPVRDPASSVVTRYRESPKSQLLHDGHHVQRHGTLRIRQMIDGRDRASAVAIAAKVGANHRELLLEKRQHAAPHEARLREAVQEEERWARA